MYKQPEISVDGHIDSAKNGAPSNAELIERIYNIALEPHSYDDFMEGWDRYISDAIASLNSLEQEVSIDSGADPLSRHFEMGFRLLEELGRTTPATFFSERSKSSGAPSFLVDKSGQVVWYNGSASRYFDLKRLVNVRELPLWEGSRDRLNDMIAALALPDRKLQGKSVLRLRSDLVDKTLFMLADFTNDNSQDRLILVQHIISTWQDSVGKMLVDSFGLSGAEVSIAEALVGNSNIAEIATQRSSSINTVRTQVKTLMSKTGVNSQTDLVRFLLSLNRLAEHSEDATGHVNQGQTLSFRQRHGRLVPFHLYGPAKGKPFVFIHGMLDGCDLTERMIALLHEHNVALIAPERPFFGSADGDEGDIKTAPERMAHDIEDLLDHLKLSTVGLIGHMAGSVYAFAATAALGDRINAIISVAGGVPIISNDQFASMSPRQQLVAYTARYTPKLLPFVLRAGIRQLDFGGERSFMNALYERSSYDLELVAKEEEAGIVRAGYHFAIAQGHRAFEIDSYHVVRDWGEMVAACDQPITLVHGAHDPVVSIQSVQNFASSLGQRAKLIMHKEAGQLLLYQSPEMLIKALLEAD